MGKKRTDKPGTPRTAKKQRSSRGTPRTSQSESRPAEAVDSPPRIVGGQFRGRKLLYSGDRRTRPMKDRVREAVFNLVGPGVKGTHAIDLFAGTGALGLEALSRGARCATLIELHFPSVRLIKRNVDLLGVGDAAEVIGGDVFRWAATLCENNPSGAARLAEPLLVLCSPPYEFYESRREDVLQLLSILLQLAPGGSIFVVESDERFDPACLPPKDGSEKNWDTRTYFPAVVSVLHC